MAKYKIPKEVINILKELEKANFEAFFPPKADQPLAGVGKKVNENLK